MSEPGYENSPEAAPRPRLLWGCKAIGEYLGITTRAARHLIKTSGLPVIRLRQRCIAARPESLDAWLDELDQTPRPTEAVSAVPVHPRRSRRYG